MESRHLEMHQGDTGAHDITWLLAIVGAYFLGRALALLIHEHRRSQRSVR